MGLLLLALAPLLMATEARPPRAAVAGILHESNSFSTVQTTLADFERARFSRGGEVPRDWGGSNHEVAGFLEGARQHGLEVYPLLATHATPSGPLNREAFEALTGELLRRLKEAPPLDGLLLALHGAMVSQEHPDADCEIVRRLRQAMGPAFPIIVTHDFHANVPEEMARYATALLTYQTNPHVDQRARGLKAAEILARTARGQARPVTAIVKPPMIYNIRFQNTNLAPLLPIVEESRKLEAAPGVLAASVSGGYQYADVPAVGPSVVVVTDNQPDLARREAQRLADMLWATRDKLALNLPDAAEAVRLASASDRTPVVLVEMGDNIGGGSAGDATFLLAELLRQKAQGWVVVIADPEAVSAAVRAGVGNPFEAHAGGKTDRLHGDPVLIRGRVKSLHDGRYLETAVRHGGERHLDQGLTAVIEAQGSTRDLPNIVMLTTRRHPPFSLHQLISCGVYPERQKILVVKAAIAFRAAYEPIAGRIIEVDTGGVTAVNPARFTYRRARRPLFGLGQ